jgi:hypothetical protein
LGRRPVGQPAGTSAGQTSREQVVSGIREQARLALSEVTDRVHLTVPPSSDYLRTVRLVAADAGARVGLDCEEIEDFRIAVDELCHLVMSNTDHYIDLWVSAGDGCLVARGQAPCRPQTTPQVPTELSALIIRSTTDYYEVETDNGAITFTAVKYAPNAMAEHQ